MSMTLEKLLKEHQTLNRMRRRLYAARGRRAPLFRRGMFLATLGIVPLDGIWPFWTPQFTTAEANELAAIKLLKHIKVKEINALLKPKGLVIRWGDSGNIITVEER